MTNTSRCAYLTPPDYEDSTKPHQCTRPFGHGGPHEFVARPLPSDPTDQTYVWIVFSTSGGVFSTYINDEDRAYRCAQAIGGVVLRFPVYADFREQVTP
jgi:hypothetical protein